MGWKRFLYFSFTPLLFILFFADHGVEAGEMQCRGKVNLNTATEKDLAAVAGLTPCMARNIIVFRRDHGPFRRLDTLLKVPGMTPALLKRIGVYTDVDGGIYCPSPPGAGPGDEWEEEPKLTVPKC